MTRAVSSRLQPKRLFGGEGSHSEEFARRSAPGPGLPARSRILCCKCQKDKPREGSIVRAGVLRICADCKGGAK
jgi:hypothetical protein